MHLSVLRGNVRADHIPGGLSIETFTNRGTDFGEFRLRLALERRRRFLQGTGRRRLYAGNCHEEAAYEAQLNPRFAHPLLSRRHVRPPFFSGTTDAATAAFSTIALYKITYRY